MFSEFDLDLRPLKAHIWLPIRILWTLSLYLVPFSRYLTSKFLFLYHSKAHIFDFYEHQLSISYRFRDIQLQSFYCWTLTFDLWRGQKCIPFESIYMTLCLTSKDTISLSRTVLEIIDFGVFRVWPTPLTSIGHLGSEFFILFQSSYVTP